MCWARRTSISTWGPAHAGPFVFLAAGGPLGAPVKEGGTNRQVVPVWRRRLGTREAVSRSRCDVSPALSARRFGPSPSSTETGEPLRGRACPRLQGPSAHVNFMLDNDAFVNLAVGCDACRLRRPATWSAEPAEVQFVSGLRRRAWAVVGDRR